jgi:hypothetical protein
MFECTVTVGDEEQSSYYGMSLPHAMELAFFRHAYLPWCQSSTFAEDKLESDYEAVTESRTNPITASFSNAFTTIWRGRAA